MYVYIKLYFNIYKCMKRYITHTVASMVVCFRFMMEKALITQQCFGFPGIKAASGSHSAPTADSLRAGDTVWQMTWTTRKAVPSHTMACSAATKGIFTTSGLGNCLGIRLPAGAGDCRPLCHCFCFLLSPSTHPSRKQLCGA